MNGHALSLTAVTGLMAIGGAAVEAQQQAETLQPRERAVSLSLAETLRVGEAGAGDPLVLIPGHLGSAFAFRRVVPGLVAVGCRVLVVEPLGVGGSSRPAVADYSLTAQADRLERVLEALGVERALVAGHAVAGSIALRLAYRHPPRVGGVLLLDAGPAEAATTPSFRHALSLVPLFKRLVTARRIRAAVRNNLVARSADAGWVTEEVVDGYVAAAAADVDATLAAYRGMARAREPEPIGPHLGEIACPIRLVMGGAPHDGGPGPDQLRVLRERLPSLVVEIVPGVGHFLFEEDPVAFVAAVERARAAARTRAAVAER